MKNKREKWRVNKKWTDNQIGDEGASAISESLKINTTLTELYLYGDEIRNKNEKTKEKRKMKSKQKNEQTTILEMKELLQ